MPGPRLVYSELRNEFVHVGVELDHHLVGVVMIAGQVVARGVPRGPPELLDPGCAQRVGGHRMIRVTFEFESDVMDPRFRGRDHVDHVVIAIAGQESRDALNVVGVPEA